MFRALRLGDLRLGGIPEVSGRATGGVLGAPWIGKLGRRFGGPKESGR